MTRAETDWSAAGPDELVAEAKRRWKPLRTFCLFSGGGDSTVLAHRLREHYDELLYIDTGTAIPTSEEPAIGGVEDHVRALAASLDKPVSIRRSGDAYRTLVLGDHLWWRRYRIAAGQRPGLTIEDWIAEDRAAGRTATRTYGKPPWGFPGPGYHGRAYSELKERRIDDVLRETKVGHPRSSTVLFLSGLRRAESRRRSKREAFSGRRSGKFCAPLIGWSTVQMADYRRRFDLPTSDVSALLHRSGECNCGAFARAAEERSLMRTFWPAWWATTIEDLEREAEAAGIRWCRWGGFDAAGNHVTGSVKLPPDSLCESCELRGSAGAGGGGDDAGPDALEDALPDASAGSEIVAKPPRGRERGHTENPKSLPQPKSAQ